jgi:hypothetical protein
MTTGRFLFGVPTARGIGWAVLFIAVSGGLACLLYVGKDLGNKGWHEFWIRVADTLLQGALGGILFAVLKAIVDDAKAVAIVDDAKAVVAPETRNAHREQT